MSIAKDSTLTGGKGIVQTRRDKTLIFGPDDFATGPCGWEPLLNSTTPVGPVTPTQWPSHENRGGLQISIEDGGPSINPWNYSMAVKRLTLPKASIIRWDMWLAVAAYHATSGNWIAPRDIGLGLDTGYSPLADGSNNRAFYNFRWRLYDQAAGAPALQWQVGSGTAVSPTYTDIPGAVYKYGFNEGKRGMLHVTMEFDIANRQYAGLRINDLGFGTLSDDPVANADALRTLAPPTLSALNQGGAASFYGGMNACFEMNGRTDSPLTKAKAIMSSPTMWAV